MTPFLVLGDGLRDDRRKLFFGEDTKHLCFGKIWVSERGFDDSRLSIGQERTRNARGRAAGQGDFLAKGKLRQLRNNLVFRFAFEIR